MRSILACILSCFLLLSCSKNDNLNQVEETIYVRQNGADMPVHLYGNFASNVVILIVHGGPGGNGLEYRSGKYVEALEANYGMAYWDQRGQGMSHGVFDDSEISIDNMVTDLKAVINSIKSKYGSTINVYALGHSWGGTLTAKYMITDQNQSLLTGWIESNGAHDIPQLNKDAVSMFINEAQTQIKLGNHVTEWQGILDWATAIDTNNITEAHSSEINSKAYEAEGWLTDDGIINKSEGGGIQSRLLRSPNNPLVAGLIGNQTSGKLNNEVEATALTDQLNKVNIPTLLLWGRYDFVVPPSLGIDCHREISSSYKKLVIFDKSGHSPMDNEWEAYVNEIDQFIANTKK